jgi:hypothetical protein
MQISFHPQGRFRDRQIDRIRAWLRSEVLNPQVLSIISATQVSKNIRSWQATTGRLAQRIPLVNVPNAGRLACRRMPRCMSAAG